MSSTIEILFNANDSKNPRNNDSILITQHTKNCNHEFRVVFKEPDRIYESFLSVKEVVSFCYNLFYALSMDDRASYKAFTLYVPSYPGILILLENLNEDKINKMCQMIGMCCDNWPSCKKMEPVVNKDK